MQVVLANGDPIKVEFLLSLKGLFISILKHFFIRFWQIIDSELDFVSLSIY